MRPWFGKSIRGASVVSEHLVLRFSQAIAHAEGFYEATRDGKPDLPERCNNPGDLTDDGDVGLGTARSKGIGATDITIYATVSDGWSALYKKVRRALNGYSIVYPASMSIEQFGMKYSEDPDWGKNVAAQLGVPPDLTIEQLVAQDPVSQNMKWPNA
jgi:hypothetical protein